MKANEKAMELCVKFFEPSVFEYEKKQYFEEMAKQCALICVDEIVSEHLDEGINSYVQKRIDYWSEVKQEINKL